jgi:hypothetical protein
MENQNENHPAVDKKAMLKNLFLFIFCWSTRVIFHDIVNIPHDER